MRSQAAGWGLDAARIGVLGFSAGGHVAASLATRFAARTHDAVDEVDALSARPDFCVLLYPVISMQPPIAHAGSRRQLLGPDPSASDEALRSPDLQVTAETPPALIVLADDDQSVVPENGIRYYQALHRAGVPAELHVYARGGHGFGMRKAGLLPIAAWPSVMWAWLAERGLTQPATGAAEGQPPAPDGRKR